MPFRSFPKHSLVQCQELLEVLFASIQNKMHLFSLFVKDTHLHVPRLIEKIELIKFTTIKIQNKINLNLFSKRPIFRSLNSKDWIVSRIIPVLRLNDLKHRNSWKMEEALIFLQPRSFKVRLKGITYQTTKTSDRGWEERLYANMKTGHKF